jgi:DNA mismatch endonuclease, patch repair protein
MASLGRPRASSERVRLQMSRQQTRDTTPEMAVRRLLHRDGLRYRVNYQALPSVRRRPDVVFTKARVAVFVDGCFWHGCPIHKTSPKANASWWAAKLARNVERDRETDERLTQAGWVVLRVWEHEDPEPAAARIREMVSSRQG